MPDSSNPDLNIETAITEIHSNSDQTVESANGSETNEDEATKIDPPTLPSLSRLEARIESIGRVVDYLAKSRRCIEAELTHLTRETEALASTLRGMNAGTAAPRSELSPGAALFVGHHVNPRQLDAAYVAFEDAFRGTREAVRDKQTVHIPVLREAGIGGPDMPVLDLGCGRGEWLELLRDHGLTARGVDQNQVMLEQCRNLGLDVVEADVLSYLGGLPENSLGAVTGFHIVEHIPFPAVVALIDESLRALKPGGLVILETPNPANFHVGAQTFYMDPTHLKPLPSAMLRFFVQQRGFCDVRVLELQPFPESLMLPEDPHGIGPRLNACLYGPQDYAVIGRKA